MASEGDNIMIYVTSSLSSEAVRKMLWTEEMKDAEFLVIKHLAKYTAQQVCQHHRENYPLGSEADSKLFIIFDSEDEPESETRGVLVVNLYPEYHGRPDAVRQLPATAALSVASLSVANSEWQVEREEAFKNGTDGTRAIPHFVLYNFLGSDQSDAFKAAAGAIDEGLQEVNEISSDDGNGGAVPAAQEDSSKRALVRYHAINPEQRDLDQVIARHGETVAGLGLGLGLDASRFAVVDDQREEQGTLIVQVDPRDEFRCKGPADGELLWWIAIGFMTWEDAKEFARRQPEKVVRRD